MRPQRNTSAPHGTVTRYTAGCSCFACCEVWRQYQVEHKRGDHAMLDATEARSIIAEAKRKGFSTRAIAEGSGISYNAVRFIASGDVQRVKRATVEALRGFVTAPASSTALIPAGPSLRLLRRIKSRIGAEETARRLGITRKALPPDGQSRIMSRNADRIRRLALEVGVTKRHGSDMHQLDTDKVLRLMGDQIDGLLEAADMSYDTLQEHKYRGRKASYDTIERLARALDTEPEWLIKEAV